MTEFFFLSRPKPVQNGPAPQHWPSAVPDACRGRIGQTERQEEEESCCAYHVVLGILEIWCSGGKWCGSKYIEFGSGS